MPQLICEIPEAGQQYILPGFLELADGRGEGDFLIKVVAQLSLAAAAAGDPVPPLGPMCKEARLDETRTRWSVTDLGNIQLGFNYVNLWAQFDSTALAFALPVQIEGIGMSPTHLPAPGAAGVPVPPAPPLPVPRAFAAAAMPPAAAVAAALGLPPAFDVRLRRTHIAHLAGGVSVPPFLSTLLNSRILQAEPIRLEFDFALSDWTKLVWSASRDTVHLAESQFEDPESSSAWRLEIPIPPGAPWIANVYLRRTTAIGVHEDQWYRIGFDPALEQNYFSPTLGVHILKVTADYSSVV